MVNSLLHATPHLERLRLLITQVYSDGIGFLGQEAGLLQSLTLQTCHEVTSADLQALAPHCIRLRTLCVKDGGQLSDGVLDAFAVRCPELQCVRVDSTCPASGLRSAVQHCGARLLFLSLTSMVLHPAALDAVARHCTRLEALQLVRCKELDTACLVRLVSSLTALRQLVLSHCDAVTDDVVTSISQRLTQLSFLSLYKVSGFTATGALRRPRRYSVSTWSRTTACLPSWRVICGTSLDRNL